ncbi:MAG: cupin domain-containing protein [Janthinobacterium lividum]
MNTFATVIPAAAGTPLTVLGDRLLLKLTSADTAGCFTLVEQFNEPGTGIPLHRHTREDESFWVLEGQVEFVIGDTTTIVEPGVVVYAPRNVAHSFRAVSATPTRMLVHVWPAGLETMFGELSQLPAGPPDLGQVAAICAHYGISFL